MCRWKLSVGDATEVLFHALPWMGFPSQELACRQGLTLEVEPWKMGRRELDLSTKKTCWSSKITVGYCWILPSWVKISQHLVRCCIDVTQMFSLVTCLFFVIYPAVTQRCCLQAWTCCIQELERLQDILSFADDGAFYAGEESEFGPVPVAKIKETIGNIGFKWFKCIVHWEGLQYPIWQDWQVTTFCLSGCKWGKSWQ